MLEKLAKIPGTNILVDKLKVLAVFIDKPNEFQERVVILFEDGERKVIIGDLQIQRNDGASYLKKLKEVFFNDLDQLADSIICRTNLIELIQLIGNKLLIKVKNYTISVEASRIFVNSFVSKWGCFLPHFFVWKPLYIWYYPVNLIFNFLKWISILRKYQV